MFIFPRECLRENISVMYYSEGGNYWRKWSEFVNANL